MRGPNSSDGAGLGDQLGCWPRQKKQGARLDLELGQAARAGLELGQAELGLRSYKPCARGMLRGCSRSVRTAARRAGSHGVLAGRAGWSRG